ncbi:mediator complex, subunit Med21 [Tuber borchii]|uniref:Mediator of RNA polymerase II transcription subunit 21 n=1 Tax=Tuber borchii TaxID=42251 RepID=A0A2T6ZX98_TUBBO|nr:mediator complex, subunit Med21 [Tuber borchii]
MADRLSQLQDAIDQMATQFFSALRYIGTHHDAVPVGNEAKVTDDTAVIDDKTTFDAAKGELARDLIVKSKQIEFLITSLPGIGVSEDEQQERLKNLETELKEAEEKRCRAVRDREEAAEKLDAVIRRLRRF